MTDVSGDLRTVLCRHPNCAREAKQTRGVFAYLCDEHVDAKRRASSTDPAVRLGGGLHDRLARDTRPAPRHRREGTRPEEGRSGDRDRRVQGGPGRAPRRDRSTPRQPAERS